MKATGEALRFFVFTNLYIAACVACFTSKTSLLLYGNYGNIHVILLAFSSTVFLYGFHRIYRRFRLHSDEHGEERHRWVDKRKKLVTTIIITAFIIACYEMLYMPLRVWLMLAPVGIIAAGYSIPFIKTKKGYSRLRDISWLKALWIGIDYAWLTAFLPVAYLHPLHYLWQPQVLFIFTENLLFMFVLAVPFDIRDLEYDKRNGLHTVPVLLGIKGAVKLGIALLACFVVVVFIHLKYAGLGLNEALVLLVSAIEAACFIPLSKPEKPNLFFPLAIESSMIIQWALIIVALKVL